MKRNRQLIYMGIFCLSLLLTVGCSATREVAVVSHGEGVALVEEPISDNVNVATLPPSVVVPERPPLKQEKEVTTPLVTTPQASPLAKRGLVEKEIFAQSAADTTLPWTLQDILFDYDQMAIRRDAVPLLEQNAKVLLKRYPNREVLIQGHCDERGTEAYNLILGERRASSVKNYLVNLGVEASRLRVLSLGKSQPFCLERTIPCFRQNRRAHFVLK